MKKFLPKNLTALLLSLLILTLVIQNPLPIAKLLFRMAPVAQAEEIVRYFEEEAIIDGVEKINKSVVEIGIYSVTRQEPLKILQERGRATGVIVAGNGLILTNRHIFNKGNYFKVVVNDTDVYEVIDAIKSPVNDFALLKIDASGLPSAKLGNSKTLKLGQTILAIGWANGDYRKTVSRGVVSGLGRTFFASDGQLTEQLTDLIQTDAMINEGGSGGPVINIKGEVIGISTAIDKDARAVNFALPIHKAKPMVELYKKTGKYEPGWMGIYYVPVNAAARKEYNLAYNYGAYLISEESGKYPAVKEGSPADEGGLLEGDLILEINSTRINENNPLSDIIQSHRAGETIRLRIYRNGMGLVKNVVLGKWPTDLDPLNP